MRALGSTYSLALLEPPRPTPRIARASQIFRSAAALRRGVPALARRPHDVLARTVRNALPHCAPSASAARSRSTSCASAPAIGKDRQRASRLASAVGLYGRSAEGNAAAITGPSLVTLASLFVPLVALALGYDAIVGERERNTLGLLLSMPVGRTEVIVGKFVGRALALCLAVALGLGAAMLAAAPGEARTLAALLGPTMALGLAFVSVGLLVSTLVSRQSTAASVVVAVWFLFVFFYDLGLLALLVATEGAIGDELVSSLVVGNPTGLYRVSLLASPAASTRLP
ncbi:MAG: ABC transporter permease subunit [Polyangiales bacterium]